MTKMIKRLLGAVVLSMGLVLGATSSQAGFIGNTIEATAFFPDLINPSVIGGPVLAVVGAGIEFVDGDFGAFFGPSFDFDDTTITITHAATGHQSGVFNGYQFFDFNNTISNILGVTILSDTTGFFSGQPSRVFFDSENVFVNFESLQFAGLANPTIVLQVRIPEPSTLALLGVGLVGMGFMMRRRRKTV